MTFESSCSIAMACLCSDSVAWLPLVGAADAVVSEVLMSILSVLRIGPAGHAASMVEGGERRRHRQMPRAPAPGKLARTDPTAWRCSNVGPGTARLVDRATRHPFRWRCVASLLH